MVNLMYLPKGLGFRYSKAFKYTLQDSFKCHPITSKSLDALEKSG